MESYVETNPLLDLPQPQDLLHLRHQLRLPHLPVLVVHDGWLLQTEKPPQVARVRSEGRS